MYVCGPETAPRIIHVNWAAIISGTNILETIVPLIITYII